MFTKLRCSPDCLTWALGQFLQCIIPHAEFSQWCIINYSWVGCYNIGYHPKLIFNSNCVTSPSSVASISVVQLFWNFAQSMALSLPCSVQNFKMIGQLKIEVWTTEICTEDEFRRAILYCADPFGWASLPCAPSDPNWEVTRAAVIMIIALMGSSGEIEREGRENIPDEGSNRSSTY